MLALPSRARAAFEDLGAGGRAPGMGNAFAAVADDVYTIHYNPAGLGLLTRPELGTSYSKLLSGLSDNSSLSTSFLGYAHPLREGQSGTVGGAWEQFALNGSLYQENSLYLSYGRLALKDLGPGELYAGGSFKYLQHSFGSVSEADNAVQVFPGGTRQPGTADPVLQGRHSTGAADLDLGALYRLKQHYALGMSLTHLAQPNVAFSGASDRLPLTVRIAGSYRSLLSTLAMEYETRRGATYSQDQKATLAAERWFPRLFVGDFGIRGALGIGSREYKEMSLGVSYRSRRFTVDYGFSLPINTIAGTSGSHRFGLSFRFGSLQESDESVEMVLDAMRKLKAGLVPEVKVAGRGLTREQKAILDEHIALAKSLESQARYQQALEQLSKALSLSPEDPELLKNFGRVNFIAHTIKELPSYKTDPVQAATHQGIMAYLAGSDAQAVERLAYAISLNPDDKNLDAFLTQIELTTGIKRPALARVSPTRYRLEQILTQASTAIEEGRYELAIELSESALREDPTLISAWENLGTSYFALRDYENSLRAWEKATILEKSPARRTLLADYIKSIKKVMARRQARPSITEKPKPLVPKASAAEIQRLYNDGVDYYSSGQLEKARALFQKILDMDPLYGPAVKALRRVEEEMGQK